MNTALRITAFTAGLAAAFGLALGVGNATGNGPSPRPATAAHAGHDTGAPGRTDDAAADHLPGGLQISERGYTLSVENPFVTAGAPTDLRFRILGTDGKPVTAYQQEHEKDLHLIVAPRDLSTFQHLHPTFAADGTWSAPAAVPAAGEYRVFADFTPAGAAEGLTLGADLHAAGELRPAPLPETGRTVTVDGYTVTLGGDLTPGRSGRLTLSVSKDGKPVTDLQPYLGAYGHLVALRAGDLAYLHVHPDTTAPGPEIGFTTTAPSPGDYRLFLDFKHQDTVHTAAFTLTTAAHPTEPTASHQH
ncbi:hypothetical protein GCM10018790_34610 [Kitasatospora xanthocidica]|uniref:hypothetical protein n=1 Tax=Kitasatospora xanthocidica TaxID=83382 RepID=UPI001679B677|nr:hypothetical protein [Kitasatospora xanthocidica]GHF53837.1 hypothetical protein GCM10018790_34610 [Kitasatospora xanthocidica]